jgi:ligand-binding SRPBCC domain-containing protein
MRHKFHAEQWVPYPREQVFAFFADPANLPPLIPAWQRARVEKANYVAPPGSAAGVLAAGAGSLITISFRPVPLVPLRVEWEAYIAEFCWNDFFCDVQRRGPFKRFRHCHRVWEERNGTVVSDDVEYELPLGPLGDVAHGLGVKRQVRALFNFRQKMLPILLARK